ncbi:MAG: protein YgfX [Cellvibrio sp.]|uniref:protein YgfX n=1 Tax=Cellvibrio sp. TaxID=1965322 RepID=UPI00271F8056|nr:protein YgfX [Cellvibrio sp.]
MQIPVFNKAADTENRVADSSVLKPLPLLAAVCINNSRFALLLYRCSYGLFALSLLLVFYPYIIEQPFWVLGLVLCWSGLWLVYRREIKSCVAGALSFSGNHWVLEQEGCTCQLELAGEVLCWSWLIILPLRETATGKARRLLVFADALSKDDNASLRRWLRACLTPKA